MILFNRRFSFRAVRRTVGPELVTLTMGSASFATAMIRNITDWALLAVTALSLLAMVLAAIGVWRDGRLLNAWRYPRLLDAGVPISSHPVHGELLLQLEGALAAWARLSPNLRGFLDTAPDELVALAKQACTATGFADTAQREHSLRQAREVRIHFEQLQADVFVPRAQLDTLRARSHALATAALEQRTLDAGARS